MIIHTLQENLWYFACVVLLSGQLWLNCTGSLDTKNSEFRLRTDILRNHSATILPSFNKTTPVTVKLGLAFRQILDVDEKNQIIVTNIWFRQYWKDYIMRWNASNYDEVRELHFTKNEIWVPDIALYNTASDHGMLYKRLDTQVVVNNEGSTYWLTPIQLKSECKINVKYFPFDEQICKFTFGSWTYHGFTVDLYPANPSADLANFVESTEWELIEAPFTRDVQYYGCCPEPYPTLTVHLKIRRRALFYLSNLIIPCAVIAFLASLSFFLPSDNGERISLVVTVLLSLTVYMLIVSETMPPTSDVVPLIGKFYLCTMVLIALTLLAVITTLNCCEKDHRMSPWLHRLLFVYLARVVGVTTRYQENKPSPQSVSQAFIVSNAVDATKPDQDEKDGTLTIVKEDDQLSTYVLECTGNTRRKRFCDDARDNDNEKQSNKTEWKTAGRILDRVFFLIFLVYFILMSTIIFLEAPKIRL